MNPIKTGTGSGTATFTTGCFSILAAVPLGVFLGVSAFSAFILILGYGDSHVDYTGFTPKFALKINEFGYKICVKGQGA